MSKILIISAHPDDEVIGIGGILKKLSKQHEINILFLADGITARKNSGHVNSTNYEPTEKMKAEMQKEIDIRKRHAKNALKVLGVKNMKFLDLPDNELDTVPFLKIVKEVEKEIKSTKCNMIFTHHHNDLNIDHRIAYEATITAARPLPWSTVTSVFSFEIPASTDWRHPYQFNPNLFVDISKESQSKIKALREYNYEIRKSPHPRSEEITDVIAKRWGSLSGCESAEAFEVIFSRISKNTNSLFI